MEYLFDEDNEFTDLFLAWVDDFLFQFHNIEVNEFFEKDPFIELFSQLDDMKFDQNNIEQKIVTLENEMTNKINDLAIIIKQLYELYKRDNQFVREFNAKETLELLKKIDDNFSIALLSIVKKNIE